MDFRIDVGAPANINARISHLAESETASLKNAHAAAGAAKKNRGQACDLRLRVRAAKARHHMFLTRGAGDRFGVRRLDGALFDRYESGVKPPHSKNNALLYIARFAGSIVALALILGLTPQALC